jgi:hypothetical protein
MDRFPIVKLLCEHGGNPYVKNTLSKPETAYDVASAALQHRIKTHWPQSMFANQ